MMLGKQLPAVYFNHVCSRDTYDSIDAKINLARETGCAGILFNLFYPFDTDTVDAMLLDEQRTYLARYFPAARRRMGAVRSAPQYHHAGHPRAPERWAESLAALPLLYRLVSNLDTL